MLVHRRILVRKIKNSGKPRTPRQPFTRRATSGWPGITIQSEAHQRALGAFYHANYLHNVANGWPTAEENAARADAGLGCVHCAMIRARS
jgi:hypothetical protein